MPRQSTIFGGGGGSGAFGVWTPAIVAAGVGLTNAVETSRPDVFEDRRNISGFLRDGDSIQLGVANTITYRDSSGSTIWVVVPSDINALATVFGGFFIDTTGTLLYTIGSQVVSSGNFNLYLATIDITGTINNIATMSPATMTAILNFEWPRGLTQGRGEIFPIIGTTLAVGIGQDTPLINYFVFDYTTGAITLDTTIVDGVLNTGAVLGVDKNNIICMTGQANDSFSFFGVEGSVFGTNLGFDTNTIPAVVRDAIGQVTMANNSNRFITRLDADQCLSVGTNASLTVPSRIVTMDTLTEVNAAMLFQFIGADL